MAGDSSGHHRNARVGYAQIVPNNDYGGKLTTSNDYQARQGDQSCLHQRISKKSIVDKQTGIYARATNKEVVSSGETFKERSIGRTGFKDEYKTISTYRFGDKSGYNEYLLEERFRRVNFDGSGSRINNGKCSGGSYQHHGGHGSSKYDSLSYKNYGSSSKNYGSSINNGNYGGGSYQNYGGRSNSKYGSLSFKDNGNYCGGWDKNFGDSNKGNKHGVAAAFEGNSSFQHYDLTEEYEESDIDGEEHEHDTDQPDDTEEYKESKEDEQYEEGDEEECEDYSDNFEHEENDEDGEYDSLY